MVLTDCYPITEESDVVWLYRIFLGRDPETEDVVASRLDIRLDQVLCEILVSDEFLLWTSRFNASQADIPAMLARPTTDGVMDWARRRLQPVGVFDDPADTVLLIDVLVNILAQPFPAERLETTIGRAAATRLGTDLAAASRAVRARHLSQTKLTARDVHLLYLLVLGRFPRTPSETLERTSLSATKLLTTLLSSTEFAARLDDILSGRRRLSFSTLSPTLHLWMSEVLLLRLPRDASARVAIAAFLRIPEIRNRLSSVSLGWSIDKTPAILDDLAAAYRDEHEADDRPFDEIALESGLFEPEWYLKRYDDVRRSGGDPIDHFIYAGACDDRDPGPSFHTGFYRTTYPETARFAGSAFEHYLRVGRAAGYKTKEAYPYISWMRQFDELTDEHRQWIVDDAASSRMAAPLHIQVAAKTAVPVVTEQIGFPPSHHVTGKSGEMDIARFIDGIADGTVLILSTETALLRCHASYCFARAMEHDLEAAYSDHDYLDLDGERDRPLFKPRMSPDLMARLPFAGPVVAVRLGERNRRAVVRALRRACTGDAAAAFADLLLTIDWRRIGHVPLILFSLPADQNPTFRHPDGKFDNNYEVKGFGADAAPRHVETLFPPVSIIIPTKNRWELLHACVSSLFDRTGYPEDRIELIIVDNGSDEPGSIRYLADLADRQGCRVVHDPGSFNFSRLCNCGAAASTGDVLVFLNNDTTVIDRDWLRTFTFHAQRSEIGVVGAKLLFPHGTVQHGGIVLGMRGVALHRLLGEPAAASARSDLTREMAAVTGACMAIRRSVFDQVNGFDTVLGVAFNDVDLCLRVSAAGYRNLYVADPLFHHHESLSRGQDNRHERLAISAHEALYARHRHPDAFRDDPSYNPNLSLWDIGALARPPRLLPPWRRSSSAMRILFLGSVEEYPCIRDTIATQARFFSRHGWQVTVGGAGFQDDAGDPAITVVDLSNPEEAATFAVARAVDCVVVHSSPYFPVAHLFGKIPLFYLFDHENGCADRLERDTIDLDKRMAALLARRVFVVSEAARANQSRSDAILVRPGTTHLTPWSPALGDRRARSRAELGVEDRFVILAMGDFSIDDGVDAPIRRLFDLASELRYTMSDLFADAVLVLAGTGDAAGKALAERHGVLAMTDFERLTQDDLLAASDVYVVLQEQDGFDWNTARARAMGLQVISSADPARTLPDAMNSAFLPELARLLRDTYNSWRSESLYRTSHAEGWEESLQVMIDVIADDIAASRADRWI